MRSLPSFCFVTGPHFCFVSFYLDSAENENTDVSRFEAISLLSGFVFPQSFFEACHFFAPDSSDKDDFSSKHYFAILPNGNLNKTPELAVNLVSRNRNLVNYNKVEMPK